MKEAGVDKKELRKKYRAIRDRETDRAGKSEAIVNKVYGMERFRIAHTVAVYMAMGTEPDMSSLMEAALEEGKTVAVPRVEGDELRFYGYMPGDYLSESRFGVMEPLPDPSREIGPERMDLVIVPGLCFDTERNRLGYGKGYYDRFLSVCKAFSIGVCYDSRLSDEPLPCSRHDRKVDAVITPGRIIT